MTLPSQLLSRLLIPALCLFCTLTVNGQSSGEETERKFRLNFTGGYSAQSVRFLGKTMDSQTQIMTIGYQREARNYDNGTTLWYTADLVPFIHYAYPKRDEGGRRVDQSGFGFSPFGLLLTKESSSFIKPSIKSSGGFMLLTDKFPTDKGRRLNFTFDVSLAGNMELHPALMLSFGYKFHHISNAQTGAENPGLDSNFLFINLSFN